MERAWSRRMQGDVGNVYKILIRKPEVKIKVEGVALKIILKRIRRNRRS
jgi:hypothetical protein